MFKRKANIADINKRNIVFTVTLDGLFLTEVLISVKKAHLPKFFTFQLYVCHL